MLYRVVIYYEYNLLKDYEEAVEIDKTFDLFEAAEVFISAKYGDMKIFHREEMKEFSLTNAPIPCVGILEFYYDKLQAINWYKLQ